MVSTLSIHSSLRQIVSYYIHSSDLMTFTYNVQLAGPDSTVVPQSTSTSSSIYNVTYLHDYKEEEQQCWSNRRGK